MAWVTIVYPNPACAHPTSLWTDLSVILLFPPGFSPPKFLTALLRHILDWLLTKQLHQWKTEREGSDFRGFIIFFWSVLSWVHKTVLSPPPKSLLVNIHTCSVLSWFPSVHTCMCKSRYTNSASDTHSFLFYLHMYVSVSCHSNVPGDGCVWTYIYSIYMNTYAQSNTTALQCHASYPCLKHDQDDF